MKSYCTTNIYTQKPRVAMESVMWLLNFVNFTQVLCDNRATMRSSSVGVFSVPLIDILHASAIRF